MSDTSRRGFFRTLAAGVAAVVAGPAAIALPVEATSAPARITGAFKFWHKRLAYGRFMGEDGVHGYINFGRSQHESFLGAADRLRGLITRGAPVTLVGASPVDTTRTRWEIHKIVVAGEVVPVDTYITFFGKG